MISVNNTDNMGINIGINSVNNTDNVGINIGIISVNNTGDNTLHCYVY